jgi:hypothetical protein
MNRCIAEGRTEAANCGEGAKGPDARGGNDRVNAADTVNSSVPGKVADAEKCPDARNPIVVESGAVPAR